MSRVVKHKCRHSGGADGGGLYYPCTGKWAEWSGTALFCTTCGAWQRDRFKKLPKICIDAVSVNMIIDPEQFTQNQPVEEAPLKWSWFDYGWARDICLEHGNALPCDECDDCD